MQSSCHAVLNIGSILRVVLRARLNEYGNTLLFSTREKLGQGSDRSFIQVDTFEI